MSSPRGRGYSILMVLLALGVIAYALHYISKALSTGSVPGKLGAVYHAPDFHFYALTGLAGLGALFGLALLIMSVRWLRAGRG